MELKELLDKEVSKRNSLDEFCKERPDPLWVASKYKDEYIALISALFGYGNAKKIVELLNSFNFELLNESDREIEKFYKNHYYRFQKSQDIIAIFIALKRLKEEDSLENIVFNGYKKENSIVDGLRELIFKIEQIYDYKSDGYKFLIGKPPKEKGSNGAYKRYMMFFRWMVRKDNIDLGLWKKIDKKDLLMPLDTHTFNLSQKLGLLKRKSCDLKAVIEVTEKFKEFDKNDPIKYDFALYRLGQENFFKD